MKKGFTLIELLAVIIILGILAFIVVPVVFGIINDSRMSSMEISAKKYFHNVDLTIQTDKLSKPKFNHDGVYDIIENGDAIQRESDSLRLEVLSDKTKLTEGKIIIKDGKVYNYKDIKINDYSMRIIKGKMKFFKNLQVSTLINGDPFNSRIKNLANNTTDATQGTKDITITNVEFLPYGMLPDGYTKNQLTNLRSKDIAAEGDIKAYYDENGTIYIYSEGEIKLNSNSGWMFRYFTKVKSIKNFELLNSNDIVSLYRTFEECNSLEEVNLSTLNTSNVTTMQITFNNCSSLKNLDLSNFDTSNVGDMQDMFNGCSGLVSLDLSSFDTSNVTGMNYMFANCKSLTSLELGNFSTSNVITMKGMFNNTKNMNYIDLSKADFSNVTSFSIMFNLVPNGIEIKVRDNSAKVFIETALSNSGRTGNVIVVN